MASACRRYRASLIFSRPVGTTVARRPVSSAALQYCCDRNLPGLGTTRRQEAMMPGEETPWGATWYAATMVAAPQRTALAGDVDVDVCVIGAGLAGLTTARELARRGWSVAVLEARRAAWNASGRNAGLVAPGFAERLEAIVERV